MVQHSCLYEGIVCHRRFAPVRHEFRQRLFLLYLDLSELPNLFHGRWLWSASGPNFAWFRRADHFGAPQQSLSDSIKQIVQDRYGVTHTGPIRLLTHLRYGGFFMNPISIYYCYNLQQSVEFAVAEVNNTPWNERHCYVLDLRGQSGESKQATQHKEFHVSPFLGMNFDYHFSLSCPDESLSAHIEVVDKSSQAGTTLLDATLNLKRSAITSGSLAWALARFPLMTAQVYAGIHFQALRLWLKRAPYFAHPQSPTRERRPQLSGQSVFPKAALERTSTANVSQTP